MRPIIALVACLCSATAFAQTQSSPASGSPPPLVGNPPPMVGGKPLVQVKPKAGAGPKTAAAKPAKPASGKPQSNAVRLQACLDIDDGTKDRLNCYDGVFPPQTKPQAKGQAKGKMAPAKGVAECRFTKEEDERLTCYNGFVESMPKLPKS